MSKLTAEQFRRTPEWEKQHREFEKDPILFARTLFPKMASLPSPEFHLELSDYYLDKDLKHINVIAPRDHAKTTVVGQVFALHHLIFSGFEDPFIVIISKTGKAAKRVLGAIKKMVSEPAFQYMYGHIVQGWNKRNTKKWNEEHVKFRSNQSIYATGTGMQIRGIKEGYYRPSLIILDDPEDEENTKTIDRMEGNFRYLTRAMVPALRKGGRAFVIGTPLHQRCIVMRLKKRKDWFSKHYSAEKDPKNKVPLWPEQYSWERLKKMEAAYEQDNDLSSYYQEYLCKIIPDSKRLFREEDLRYWEGDVHKVGGNNVLRWREIDEFGDPLPGRSEWNEEICDVYTGIDPATSTMTTADYFVIFHIAITRNNNRFVLPYFRDRVRPSTAIEIMIAEYKKYNSKRVSIETSGQQEIYRDVLRNRDDIHIPGLSVKHNPKEKKEKRHHEQLEPWFSASQVFIQRDMTELLNEMYMWPKCDTDDILDGFYYASLHAKPPSGSLRTVQQILKGRSSNRPKGPQGWMTS